MPNPKPPRLCPDPTTPLRSENVARAFGRRAPGTAEDVRALYALLVDAGDAARAALDRWKRLVTGACGHDVDRPSPGIEALARSFGIAFDRDHPAEVLFAVQTYYALVAKLLVSEVLASLHRLPGPTQWIGATSDGPLEGQFARLEAGAIARQLGIVDFPGDDPFAWYASAWNGAIDGLVRRLLDRLRNCRVPALGDDLPGARDLLKDLHEDLFCKPTRHMLGEYYTPDWLARHLLDEIGFDGGAGLRLLDPACGSGAFLVSAIRRIRDFWAARAAPLQASSESLRRTILAGVVGFDLNPLAVLSAKANYLIAVADLLDGAEPVCLPVLVRDSILADDDGPPMGRFDCVVGNPPWIAWDDLPADYREATKPLWQRYGLFSLSGSDARHGGGKKDLSTLMLYAAADRYLKPRGRLAMVVTQTVFQTKGAGDGFRRFRLGDGDWLGVIRVNDLADFQPFSNAANWTASVTLEKGCPTVYPVPYVRWSRDGPSRRSNGPSRRSNGLAEGDFRRRTCLAAPVDPERPTSPWLVRPLGLSIDRSRLVGPSDYRAHLGANTGGANGVYWVEILEKAGGGVRVRNLGAKGKAPVEIVEAVIEPDLLYPLVRWGDVARYRARPQACLLLAQDVDGRRGIDQRAMLGRYPRTYDYLARFRGLLERRAAYRRYQGRAAFYSMYNVGRYTVAPVKVVWRRMDRRVNAAVVEPVDDRLLGPRPVIPQETCALIAAGSLDEAHYACAVLNSAIVDFVVRSHSVRGGKGFGTPSMLDFVRLRQFEPDNPTHQSLAAAGRRAHEAIGRGGQVDPIQRQIDLLAGSLWGLDEHATLAIRGAMG